MKTFKFADLQLLPEERFTFDCLCREFQIKKMALDVYLTTFIAKRLGLPVGEGLLQYDVVKQELTFTPNIPPPPVDDPKNEEVPEVKHEEKQ